MRYAVDFDGTLAEYHGWQGIEHTGNPIPAMVGRVRKWLAQGDEVYILTARMCASKKFRVDDRNIDRAREVVQEWCMKHIGKKLDVTSEKGSFDEFWEDKAVQVIRNTGRSLEEHVEEMLQSLYTKGTSSGNSQMATAVRDTIAELKKLTKVEAD